jgi:hypothetical protein
MRVTKKKGAVITRAVPRIDLLSQWSFRKSDDAAPSQVPKPCSTHQSASNLDMKLFGSPWETLSSFFHPV